MALCYGGGPLRRSEGVWKICPARSEAEDQQVQIFSPNGTAAVFRFIFGGKKEQSLVPERIFRVSEKPKKATKASRQPSATFSG